MTEYKVKMYEPLLKEMNAKLWDLAEIRFEEKQSSALKIGRAHV